MSHSTLIFDLDGTLTDPAVGIVRCMNYALTTFNYPPRSAQQITPFIGPPLEVALHTLTGSDDEAHIKQLIVAYRERYGEFGFAENTVYDGVYAMLDELRDRDIAMGVCTSKFEKYAIKVLQEFNLFDYFQFVSGSSYKTAKAEQLRGLLKNNSIDSKAIMIGDRDIDITSAKSNGLASAAVMWGYGSHTELQAQQPDYLIEHPTELVIKLGIQS